MRRILAVAKLCIAGGALWFIWHKVFQKENTLDVLRQCSLLYHDENRRTVFIAALLLMPVNWGIEAWKWKLVVGRICQIRFTHALEGVLSGLTVSFFTPNRVGEYAGRVMYLPEGSRIKGTLLTVMENLAQLVVTLVLGFLVLPWFLARTDLPDSLLTLAAVGCIAFSILSVFLFLKMPSLGYLLPRISFLRKFEPYLRVVNLVTVSLQWTVLGWSFLRFVVFSTQLYLLLIAFGVMVPAAEAAIMIILTFFTLTLIPTFAFADLGVRSAAGAYFFGTVTAHLSGVVFATLALWLINLALPAALGAILFAFSPSRKKEPA